jgi:hypothetical protein
MIETGRRIVTRYREDEVEEEYEEIETDEEMKEKSESIGKEGKSYKGK